MVFTDWEAIADCEPNVILSSECLPRVSNLSLEDSKPGVSNLSSEHSKVEAPKRRGRGTFSYRKSELYSDQHSNDVSAPKDIENEDICKNPETKTVECKPFCLSIRFSLHKCSVYSSVIF